VYKCAEGLVGSEDHAGSFHYKLQFDVCLLIMKLVSHMIVTDRTKNTHSVNHEAVKLIMFGLLCMRKFFLCQFLQYL
jgi:hypothetical protein